MQGLKSFLEFLKLTFANIDYRVTEQINYFFSKGYFNQNYIPPLASKIPLLVKLTLYLTILLFLLIPLRITFPDSKIRSLLTYFVFILIIACVFGVFFGFFALMFSFET